MAKYKILFSIPVHERPDVILDQITNINCMSPGCAIVLHFSRDFNEEKSIITLDMLFDILKKIDNVIVNPNRLETHWGSIIQAHISNYNNTKDIDYEYFAFLSSNELFVRKNVYDYVKNYDCGYTREKQNKINIYERRNDNNKQFKKAQNDETLIKILESINPENPLMVFSSCEGAFFTKEFANKVFKSINTFFNYDNLKEIYIREEYYFGSIIENLIETGATIKCGKNFTIRCKKYSNCYEFYSSIKDADYYSKYFRDGVFSIKRVDRELNNYLRAYIRQKNKYKRVEEILIGKKIKTKAYMVCRIIDIVFLNNFIRKVLSLLGLNVFIFPETT